jgi:hypothetical protein
MTTFESDGVYAGIPYRVHPDASIEAIMLGGLIKFNNMDQFLAAAAEKSDASGSTFSYGLLSDKADRNVPASAQPIDYYSILLNGIHNAEQNPDQLRALVYDRARFNIRRELLFGHSSIGLADVVQQITAFEIAIARIEAASTEGQARIAYRKDDASQTARSMSSDAVIRMDTYTKDSQEDLTYRNEEAPRSASNNAIEIMPPRPPIPMFEYLSSVQREENFRFGQSPEKARDFGVTAIQLVASALLGMLCIAVIVMTVVLWHSSNVSPKIEAGVLPKIDAARPADAPPKLPFPVPTSFGIYALSDNKLVKLEPLPTKVPDPRIALSAEITKPSSTVISADKPSFILYRRDLLNNAPDRLTLRVVARMEQQTTIVDGKAITTKLDQSWRIRNTSLDLKVSPIPGQREMIIAREDDKLALTPGRYVLVVSGFGYDFTVAGSAPSPAHCLEQFETGNGPVFTECKAP